MKFHMINITYAAMHVRAETEKTTFPCKDDFTLTKHTRRWTYSARDFEIPPCHISLLRSFFLCCLIFSHPFILNVELVTLFLLQNWEIIGKENFQGRKSLNVSFFWKDWRNPQHWGLHKCHRNTITADVVHYYSMLLCHQINSNWHIWWGNFQSIFKSYISN